MCHESCVERQKHQLSPKEDQFTLLSRMILSFFILTQDARLENCLAARLTIGLLLAFSEYLCRTLIEQHPDRVNSYRGPNGEIQ